MRLSNWGGVLRQKYKKKKLKKKGGGGGQTERDKNHNDQMEPQIVLKGTTASVKPYGTKMLLFFDVFHDMASSAGGSCKQKIKYKFCQHVMEKEGGKNGGGGRGGSSLICICVTAGHLVVGSFISTSEQYSKITANEHTPDFNTIKD